MNQQPQQGTPMYPYNPNAPVQGNPQQPAYGQQWNPAPNFGGQPQPNRPASQPGGTQNPNGKPAKSKDKKKKKGGSLVGWIFLGIFLMLALTIGGGFLGYRTAVNARMAEFNRKSKMAAAEQYQMALADIEQEKYQNAKTRLDYVIKIDQNYPGAAETYQQVIMALYPTASPTPMMTATPMPTSTADTRGEEEMFRSIQQAIYSQQWETAIQIITALRDRNISFRGLEVDGLYYIALRNYGIQQINTGYLENGIYNIAMAESFGPIDADANSMRDAARSYLSGAGFWEINWFKALEYYANAAAVYPNLYDRATMMTANQRFAEASFHIADDYALREDYCGAIPYYEQGLPIYGSESVQLTATAVYLKCYPASQEEPAQSRGDDSTVIEYGYDNPDDIYVEEDYYYDESQNW